VLSYLHQLAKGLEIWLKIGGVAHRLAPYTEGDPPRGIQPYHDAGLLELDSTLRDFDHTQRFLESILDDALSEAGVATDDLLTDSARERLVLASGGVPRDYLSLTANALRAASRRDDAANRPRNRITAEDVSEVATVLLEQKEQELLRTRVPRMWIDCETNTLISFASVARNASGMYSLLKQQHCARSNGV
jgi:hypothetical protein